jgi:hypothetical protein
MLVTHHCSCNCQHVHGNRSSTACNSQMTRELRSSLCQLTADDCCCVRCLLTVVYQDWRPTVPPDCPPGYAQLMTACWHQDPEQRPTVQQLLRSLQNLYVAEKEQLTAERQGAETTAAPAAGAGGPSRLSMKSDRYRNAEAESAGGAASTSKGNTPQHTGSTSQQQSCNSARGASCRASAGMADTSSMDVMDLDPVSTACSLTPGTLAYLRAQLDAGIAASAVGDSPASSNRSCDMPSPSRVSSLVDAATPVATRSTCTAPAAEEAEATRDSAGSIQSTRSSTPQGPGASAGAASELGSLTSGSRALDRAARGMSALIKARADVALLRDLKIGPLLGRGAYGKVYKGELQLCMIICVALRCQADCCAFQLRCMMLCCAQHNVSATHSSLQCSMLAVPCKAPRWWLW